MNQLIFTAFLAINCATIQPAGIETVIPASEDHQDILDPCWEETLACWPICQCEPTNCVCEDGQE